MTNDLKLMRPADLVKLLGLTQQRLAELRHFGRGPAYIKIGRSVMYAESDVNAWLAACRHDTTKDGD